MATMMQLLKAKREQGSNEGVVGLVDKDGCEDSTNVSKVDLKEVLDDNVDSKEKEGVEEGGVEVVPCVKIDSLSRKDKKKLSDMLLEDFGVILSKVGLNSETAEDYLPEDLKLKKKGKKGKKGPKPKNVNLDWRNAKTKEELLGMKRTQLVEICKEAGIPCTGPNVNKKVLADRVWGIEHPDEAPEVKKGKRGRPKGAKNKSKVAKGGDSDVDSEDASVASDVIEKNEVGQKQVEDVDDNTKNSGEEDVADRSKDVDDMGSFKVRFNSNKLDPNGEDVYLRYNGTNYIVSTGDDVDYIGKLEGDTLKRGEGAEEFLEFLS